MMDTITTHSFFVPQPRLMSEVLGDKSVFYIGNNVMAFTFFRLVLRNHNTRFGFDYWWDGSKTLDLLEASLPVDLLLLDLSLANNDSGFDVFEAIHNDPRFKDIPIAAIASTNSTAGMATAKRKGFVGYIGRPLSVTWIPRQIADLLEGKPVWYGL